MGLAPLGVRGTGFPVLTGSQPVCMTRHSATVTGPVAYQDPLVCVTRHSPTATGPVAR